MLWCIVRDVITNSSETIEGEHGDMLLEPAFDYGRRAEAE